MKMNDSHVCKENHVTANISMLVYFLKCNSSVRETKHIILSILCAAWTVFIEIIISKTIRKHLTLTGAPFTILRYKYSVEILFSILRCCFMLLNSYTNKNSSNSLVGVLKVLLHLMSGTFMFSALMRVYLVLFHFFSLRYSFYYNLNVVVSNRRINIAIILGLVAIVLFYFIIVLTGRNYIFTFTITIAFFIIIFLYICMFYTVRHRKADTDGGESNIRLPRGIFFSLIPILISFAPLACIGIVDITRGVLKDIIYLHIFTSVYLILSPIIDILTTLHLKCFLLKDFNDRKAKLDISYHFFKENKRVKINSKYLQSIEDQLP